MTMGPAANTLARIQEALASASRETTIHDVKRAVIEEFERVDRRVRIHSTEYFRHSFVPDLVLNWQDDVDRPQRWVYLRSKVRPDYLLADIELIGRDQPIIFGLLPTDDDTVRSSTNRSERARLADQDMLRQRSSASGTLITDPAGLDALSTATPELDDQPITPIPDLVSRQIIRGGRGVFDQETSRETTRTINAGFVAAFQVSPEATFKAATFIRRRLGEKSGERLLRLLHAIWVGAGGRSDQFPEAPAVSGPLSDDAIELLIAGPDIEDEEFWKRLGTITLPQLGRLKVGDRPPNLGRLVGVNADKIEGRWCRVRSDQIRTGAEGKLQWGIEHGTLALHGSSFTAYLAEEKKDLLEVEPVEQRGISVDELSQRAERAHADISDVTAAGGGLIIGVASETHANVLSHPHTSESVEAAAGNITKATAALRNRRIVLCDFTTTTASSRKKGTLTLRELVRHGLPLVWTLHDDDMAWLAEMLSPVSPQLDRDEAQLSLFGALTQDDDLNDEGEPVQGPDSDPPI